VSVEESPEERARDQRADFLARRAIACGWVCVVPGAFLPLLALGGVFFGYQAMRYGRRDAGITLMVAGVLVFAVRLMLFLAE
jgi:hypothetical protein